MISAGRTLPPGWPKPVDPALALSNARKWCGQQNPGVSIIIISRDNPSYVLECIRQIWQNTEDIPYEILIVDSGSESDALSALRDLGEGIRLLALSKNRFFGEACNIAAEAALAMYLCFLKDKTFLEDNCLLTMTRVFKNREHIGAVGPRFLSGDRSLSFSSMLIDKIGNTSPLDASGATSEAAYKKSQPVDFVSADAMLIRTADFMQAGGFDLAFEPAGYEDADLCFKLRAMGREIFYCAEAQVTHIGCPPAADDTGKAGRSLRDVNREKFVARWKIGRPLPASLRADIRDETPEPATKPNGTEMPLDPALPSSRRRMVAVLTPYPLTPGGGERVVLSLAAVLGQSDLVHLITPHRYSNLRIQNLAREFGIAVPELKALTYDEFIEEEWDLTIVLGNEALPRYPAHGKRCVYICQFPFPMSKRTQRSRRGNLSGYERILTYSQYARMHTQRSLEGYEHPPVDILFPPAPLLQGDFRSKKEAILSVGRFSLGGHDKRQDLMIRAFRRLRSERGFNQNTVLHLAGATQPTDPESMEHLSVLFEMAEGLPVEFHLDAPKEILSELYRDAAVYWHATGFGADLAKEPGRAEHFGIAIVEAMSAECVPVVFGAGGPAEIITQGVDGFLFSTEGELVSSTSKLMFAGFRDSRRAMGEAARRASEKFSMKRFMDSASGYLGA
jgi:GT2 family glycosyltransferase/glycosyltransferase involved in cell wall biosynthesis